MALKLPATGMVMAIDVGDSANLHPRNKQEVGWRLALQARRVVYGAPKTVASGPEFEKQTLADNTLITKSKIQSSGLVLKDASGPYLKGFAIAGADRKFVWAQGEVQGNTMVLRSSAVIMPVAVRYAWDNMP